MGKNTEYDDGSLFNEFLLRRKSKKSTVGIVESCDKLRHEEYIERFQGIMVSQKRGAFLGKTASGLPTEVYLVDLFQGIRKVNVEIDGKIEDPEGLRVHVFTTPYTEDDGDNEEAFGSPQPFISSFPTMAGLLKRKDFTTIAIVMGIIEDQSNLNALEIFINDVCINGEMFQTMSTVMILTSVANMLPASVIANSFLIRPLPSTRDERRRQIQEIVDYHKARCQTAGKKATTLLDRSIENYLSITDGLTLNDHQAALLESLIRNDEQKIKFQDIIQQKIEIVNALKGVRISSLDDAKGFEAVGGYDAVKDYFRRKIVYVYDNYELAEQMHVKTPRGILLFGPPGTGKTFLSKQLAKALDCAFLELMFENLKSKWVGESEAQLAALLNRIDAMGEKVVVFMDELDSLGARGDGGSGTNHVHEAMFSMMLKWLSDPNRKAIIIGATNVPWNLDSAFIRDQRFDKQIYMGLPDQAAREQIFDIKLRATGLDIDPDIDIHALAAKTVWYSGANIEGITIEAQTLAFERVLQSKTKERMIKVEDVMAAMEVKKKNVKEMKEANAKFIAYAEEHCDDKNLIISIEGEETKPMSPGQAFKKNTRLS